MTSEDIRPYLEALARRPGEPTLEAARGALARLKWVAVSAGDQAGAKSIWCLEQALAVQEHYLRAFRYLKDGEFYKAWCDLERTELALSALERHDTSSWADFRLDFIQHYTTKWQGLFPYRLFASPELVQTEKVCSICGQPVLPRSFCGHRVGEIYDGEMCHRIITKLEALGIGIVDRPVQKCKSTRCSSCATRETEHRRISTTIRSWNTRSRHYANHLTHGRLSVPLGDNRTHGTPMSAETIRVRAIQARNISNAASARPAYCDHTSSSPLRCSPPTAYSRTSSSTEHPAGRLLGRWPLSRMVHDAAVLSNADCPTEPTAHAHPPNTYTRATPLHKTSAAAPTPRTPAGPPATPSPRRGADGSPARRPRTVRS